MKIAAGGRVKCGKNKGIIGAVIKYQDLNCILTVLHLLRVGRCQLGDQVEVEDYRGRVIEIIEERDLAIIDVKAPNTVFQFTRISNPVIGPAQAINFAKKIPCNAMTVGKTFNYISFPFSDIPLPGDSGSPIIQDGRVVAILASVFYNNATGIAVSLEGYQS